MKFMEYVCYKKPCSISLECFGGKNRLYKVCEDALNIINNIKKCCNTCKLYNIDNGTCVVFKAKLNLTLLDKDIEEGMKKDKDRLPDCDFYLSIEDNDVEYRRCDRCSVKFEVWELPYKDKRIKQWVCKRCYNNIMKGTKLNNKVLKNVV